MKEKTIWENSISLLKRLKVIHKNINENERCCDTGKVKDVVDARLEIKMKNKVDTRLETRH